MQQYNVCLIKISDDAVNTTDLIKVFFKKREHMRAIGLSEMTSFTPETLHYFRPKIKSCFLINYKSRLGILTD